MPTLVGTKNKANTEIQVRIKNLIERDGFTQKQLADKIDVSQTMLSLYLKNEYGGDITGLEEKLSKLLEDNKAEKIYKKVKLDFVKTTVSAKLFNIAQICQFNGEIALCTGSSGLGKTTSINQYAKEHSGVIIIDPDEGIGVRSLLYYFCKPLKIEQGINESNVAFCEKVVVRKVCCNCIEEAIKGLKVLNLDFCIRTKQELDKDRLLECDENMLLKAGISIKTEDKVRIEPNFEKLAALSAENKSL